MPMDPMKKTGLSVIGAMVVAGVVVTVLQPKNKNWKPTDDCAKVWAECDTYSEKNGYSRIGFQAHQCPEGVVVPFATKIDGSAPFEVAGACEFTKNSDREDPGMESLDFICVMPDPGVEKAECLRHIPESLGLDNRRRPAHWRQATPGEYFPKQNSLGKDCIPAPCVQVAGLPFKP